MTREKARGWIKSRERRKYGKDKGKSTLMRRAKTKASIPGEPIYDRAAIRYKCICATRNPYDPFAGIGDEARWVGTGEIERGGRPGIREQVEGCLCLSGKSRLILRVD